MKAFILIALCTLTTWCAAQNSDQRRDELLSKARYSERMDKNFVVADTIYCQLEREYPGDRKVLSWKAAYNWHWGHLNGNKARLNEAIRIYEYLKIKNPNSLELQLLLTTALYKRDAVSKDQKDFEAYKTKLNELLANPASKDIDNLVVTYAQQDAQELNSLK